LVATALFMKKIEKNDDFYFPKWKNDGKIVRREKKLQSKRFACLL